MTDVTESGSQGKSKQVTKSRTVRANLEGKEYLLYHHIAGRLCFSEKMNERMQEEAILKMALALLGKEVDRRVALGEEFIDADSLIEV